MELGRTRIGGIMRRPECLIDATLAEIVCLMSDGHATLGPLTVPAYLAESDEVAALIGFAGVFDHATFHLDVRQGDAWISD